MALRIICDREEEINAFIPEEYWSLNAELLVDKSEKPIIAKYYGEGNSKKEILSGEQAQKILEEVQKEKLVISDVKKGERVKKAPLPFITSTLQQEASKALNFTTNKTMRIAQQLYEGIDIKGNGTVGIITYLRTDSTRISNEAQENAFEYIKETYGEEFAETIGQKVKVKAKIQDAHEAIRPTEIEREPLSIKASLSRDQYRLYTLIWKRFVASRMKPAVYETEAVKMDAGKHRFTFAAGKIIFEGFLGVYKEAKEEDSLIDEEFHTFVTMDSKIKVKEFEKKQHFTQAPGHFTEASLVRTLEELGIGRPSTYAPTIYTIMRRRYIVKEGKKLFVSELGEVVNGIMIKAFASIVDANFTANMEALLDKVEEGSVTWKSVISNFYPDLNAAVLLAEKELESVTIADEVTDVICEECGKNMIIKYGPHGKFLACPGFPECRNTKTYLEKIGVPCPKCDKEIVVRKTKKGRRYYGCEDNPNCDFMEIGRASCRERV